LILKYWPVALERLTEFKLTNIFAQLRITTGSDDAYVLRETEGYGPVFGVKNEPIGLKYAYFWDVFC
jgi:hypothetical protein